jgi:RNA polymerase sigma-70 factor (ECF subfamily)
MSFCAVNSPRIRNSISKGITVSPADRTQLRPLETYRPYLQALARRKFAKRLRTKLDPADLVQQTLLAAHRAEARFHGHTIAQQKAWLRQILSTTLAQELRRFSTKKRQLWMEHSLEDALEDPACNVTARLDTERTSANQKMIQREELLTLEEALKELPLQQRVAVELRHLQGWSLETISEHMGCTKHAAAGLLRRGLRSLRNQLGDDQTSISRP